MATKVPPLALDSTKDFSALVPAAFAAANAAYAQSNSTVTLVSEVFEKANTAADSGSNANAAFLQANVAISNAAGASLYANAAFTAANNAVDTWVRDAANAASSYANSAYIQANTALSNTNLNVTGTLRALSQGGDEGGELFLDKPVTNTSLSAGITIDIFQNKLRFFETGGSVRGVFIDMANSAAAGVGTDLLNPTSTPDTVARTTAAAAFLHANAAFIQANTGGAGADQFARDTANAAFLQANTDIISFSMPGNITSPVTGNARYYPTDTIVINTVYANLGTSPTGNFTFIIKKNGVSIGNTFILSSAVMTPNAVNVSLTTSDYLTLDVTGVNGSDLSVKLKYSY
jgi:hypothetical protein